MNTRFCARILQPGAETNLWTLEWIAGVMQQDLLNTEQGWQVHTPVQALPFDHQSFGFRADNHTFPRPLRLFAQADDEGTQELEGRLCTSVMLQANFDTPGGWQPGMQESLIPKALDAMQSLFVAAAGVSGADFWIPLK
jgi:hypothetical protein